MAQELMATGTQLYDPHTPQATTMLSSARFPALLTALCLLVGTVLAHGGQYRGPTSGGPGVPPGPQSPGAPVLGGPTTGGNANLDKTSWQVWWQLNQDRYVGATGNATAKDRSDVAIPAMRFALERSKSPDVLSASLIALGKCAVDDPKLEVRQVLKKHLADANGEVREAAVLGLGLSGLATAIEDLSGLLNDTGAGRKLTGRSNVDERMRTFSGYALGLLAQRSNSAEAVGKALDGLLVALSDQSLQERDVLTGVLNGIRLLGLNLGEGATYQRLRWQAMDALEAHLARNLSAKLAVAQSHALTAFAQLARNGSERDRERAIRLAVDVLERGREAEAASYVSATIVLGELLQPKDSEAIAVLVKQVSQPRDSLVPKFAMIAFGQIGGPTALEQLTKAFRDGKRDVQPWAALGLGLLAHEPVVAAAAAPATGTKSVKPAFRSEVESVLLGALKSEGRDELKGAIALGLGLAGVRAAAPLLHKIATDTRSHDHKGHLLVALAMLDHRPSLNLAKSGLGSTGVYLGHAALALAQYGERGGSSEVATSLAGIVMSPDYLTGLAACAQALGHLKNAADLPSLVLMVLYDKARIPRHARGEASIEDYRAAFAAAAIGAIADRDPRGFGAQIARGMNYTPNEQTISNGKTGIIDIF